ncbi:hypothetical protein U0021_09100 [Moraxella canis]|uniref:Uncharacterized protein n=1 Tax=Moraxella canis TaxID=90239 RepID=A0ABZ0WXA0_9GAMM|nr:hypothetical protein U0021_09100 [Moraxella canis]
MNNVGQTQWNYLTHTELSAWKTSLINCSGNQECIAQVNAKYDNLNKTNFNHFKNYCATDFNSHRCSNLIRHFQAGTQGDYNLKHLPGLYTDISRLGGTHASTTINSVKINNATGGYLIRDTGINHINRYNGNEAQALVGELANERLYGGGRAGTVVGNDRYGVGVNTKGTTINSSDVAVGTINPVTGHRVLGQHTVERGSTSDYIVEGSKPSTKGSLITIQRQYYENPGHHDPRGGGNNRYDSTKSVLPANHINLWERSIMTSDGNRWARENQNGRIVYHRFQNDGNGNFHWNGSTDGVTNSGKDRRISINHVPNSIRGK